MEPVLATSGDTRADVGPILGSLITEKNVSSRKGSPQSAPGWDVSLSSPTRAFAANDLNPGRETGL